MASVATASQPARPFDSLPLGGDRPPSPSPAKVVEASDA